MYAWSRHPSLGYYKHPPLGAWVTALWFKLFPTYDWAFWLLAVCNAALALYMVDLIARRYLSGDKRLLVVLLLLLTPFYQFRAVPFGANQLVLSIWPAAVYCFLRAFETRRLGWAVAAGATAALAMLGKYYSIFLVMGLLVAAVGIAGFVAATTLLILLASPAVAWAKFIDVEDSREYYRLLANENTKRWESRSDRPLSIVTGDTDLANAMSFYAHSHPDVLPFFDLRAAPWIGADRLTSEGYLAICKAIDMYCIAHAEAFSGDRPGIVRVNLRLIPKFLGFSGPPGEFLMLLVPPPQSVARERTELPSGAIAITSTMASFRSFVPRTA